jgi:hypothetical protein
LLTPKKFMKNAGQKALAAKRAKPGLLEEAARKTRATRLARKNAVVAATGPLGK